MPLSHVDIAPSGVKSLPPSDIEQCLGARFQVAGNADDGISTCPVSSYCGLGRAIANEVKILLSLYLRALNVDPALLVIKVQRVQVRKAGTKANRPNDGVYFNLGAICFDDAVFVQALKYRPAIQCRSEEHTSELQSRGQVVCRLLLDKKQRS